MKISKDKKPKSKVKKILSICSTVLFSIILIAVIIGIIFVSISKARGEEPNLFGYRFLYILTNSMEPELPAGSSIIVKNCTAEDIKVGDYVVYYTDDELKSLYNVDYVTHECKATLFTNSEGKQVIITQGLKAGAIPEEVEAERVSAVFVGKIPSFFNGLFTFILTPYGFATLICVPIIVFLALQLFSQIKAIKKKEKEKSEEELLKEEIQKRTDAITKEAQDFFMQEQEKIKQFLQSQQNNNDNKNDNED